MYKDYFRGDSYIHVYFNVKLWEREATEGWQLFLQFKTNPGLLSVSKAQKRRVAKLTDYKTGTSGQMLSHFGLIRPLIIRVCQLVLLKAWELK